jgi:hypothetical protein
VSMGPFRSAFSERCHWFLQPGGPPSEKVKAPDHSPNYAAAFAVPLKNASSSLLIVSASVVGMP